MRSELIGAGALLSALLALSCCGTALLFLIFGVSMASFGFLDVLTPYRIWFQLLSVLLLALAWGRYYRRRFCARNGKSSFWVLLGISLLLVALLAIPYMEFE
jgi:phosphoglycerol transferase MdoB-like AlkP superfamily enzyme